MTAANIEPLWTVEDVAALLQVPVKTIYEWRRHRKGPDATRVGKYLRFDPQDVRDWLKSQREHR